VEVASSAHWGRRDSSPDAPVITATKPAKGVSQSQSLVIAAIAMKSPQSSGNKFKTATEDEDR
jgi:hypothetical protein